jgi:hypothetical protein
MSSIRFATRLLAPALLCCAALGAQDWTNLGGNSARNGFAYPLGPRSPTAAWTNSTDFSIIAWAPFVSEGRVFTIRESGFPQNGGAANDALVAYDLTGGGELWRTTLPFGGNTSTEWIAWIAGAQGGRVYASRSSNGLPQPVRAFDAASGAPLWTSAAATESWAHDGAVFAPDGDLIVGDFDTVVRIDAPTGATVWTAVRNRAVSGNCGAAVGNDAVYIDQTAFGGNLLTKLDLATGAFLYNSPLMPGFTEQNTPFLSHDGKTVYFSRSQNNPPVDRLYAFRDDGSAFIPLWNRPVRWTTSHEHGLAPNGSIYTFLPNDEFVRLDAATGNVTASAGVLSPLGSPNVSPKTVVDAAGTVYVSNGWANTPSTNGRVWAFSGDLATAYFTLQLDNPNQGGPVLGANGTLVVCDRVAVRAWRSVNVPQTYCTAKTNTDGCEPPIYAAGVPSASAGSGFTVGAWQVLAANNGILIYSKTGSASVPFQGGFLCLASPVVRTAMQNAGGSGPCGGSFAFDFNAYIATGFDPALVAGQNVWCQYWARDPGSPSGSSLSNGLQFMIGN